MDWEQVLTDVGGTGAIAFSVAWLVRQLVSRGLEKDLETHKARLKAESDSELARLTSSLELATQREWQRFSAFFPEQASVLARTYLLTVRTHDAMKQLLREGTLPGEIYDKDRDAKIASDAGNELRQYFNEHRIYFEQSTCELFDGLFLDLKSVFDQVMIERDRRARQREVQGGPALSEKAAAAEYLRFKSQQERMQSRIPKARRALEDEFRRLLGVHSASASSSRTERHD